MNYNAHTLAGPPMTVLDTKLDVRVMLNEKQGLCAKAASDIDNQRALRELSPGVPCQFDV